ncbi:hypothetical protein AB2L28_17745 [Kineococcus sp. TBRC 1896]|uniref:Bacterial OB-fold domain-containing protein n=1 Tax=Kineococcus mangrovi TaxID=1660183 RepID=A0ABV4I8L9_9ACTN
MLNDRHRFGPLTLAAVLTLGLAAGCSEDTVVEDAQEDGPVAAGAILGEPVTVQADVQDVYGSNAFTIGGGDTLVLGDTGPDVDEDARVSVTGTVRQLVTADFEEDYDWFTFGEEDWVTDRDRDLVIIADEVQELP